jgi:hypothetical protein
VEGLFKMDLRTVRGGGGDYELNFCGSGTEATSGLL